MKQKTQQQTGAEPGISLSHLLRSSGLEPGLSHLFEDRYGHWQVEGLEAPEVCGRRRPLVALAEYDNNLAELVCLLAESNGYDVRRTDNGAHLLALVKSLQPDMVVTGLRLPGMSGLELIRQLRVNEDPLISHVPVLILDVRHSGHAAWKVFESGADDYFEMPGELTAMLRAWRRVVAHIRRPSPLTALLNEDEIVRNTALSFLLETQPPGLEAGLGELLWQPDPAVRMLVRWALRLLNTQESQEILSRSPLK
nr:response regulator [Anaerolineae bacterium]